MRYSVGDHPSSVPLALATVRVSSILPGHHMRPLILHGDRLDLVLDLSQHRGSPRGTFPFMGLAFYFQGSKQAAMSTISLNTHSDFLL